MLGNPHSSRYTNEFRCETTHFRQKLFHHTMRSAVIPQGCRHACLKQAWCMSQTCRKKIDKVAPEADGDYVSPPLHHRRVNNACRRSEAKSAGRDCCSDEQEDTPRTSSSSRPRSASDPRSPLGRWPLFELDSKWTAWPPRSMRGLLIMSTQRGGDRQGRRHALVRRPDYQVCTHGWTASTQN